MRKTRNAASKGAANKSVSVTVNVPKSNAKAPKLSRAGVQYDRTGALFQRTDSAAKTYLEAMLDPFSEMNPLPKVPDDICVRTMSSRGKIVISVSPTSEGNLVAAFTPTFQTLPTSIVGSSGQNYSIAVTSPFFPDMYPLCVAASSSSFTSGEQTAWDLGADFSISANQVTLRGGGSGDGGNSVVAGTRCVAAGMRVTFSGNYATTDGVLYGTTLPKECIIPFYYAIEGDLLQGSGGQGATAFNELGDISAPRNLGEVVSTYGTEAIPAEDGIQVNWVPQDPQSVTFTPSTKFNGLRKTQLPQVISDAIITEDQFHQGVDPQVNPIPSCFIWGSGLNPSAKYVIECHAIFEHTIGPGLSSFLPTNPSPTDVLGFQSALAIANRVPKVMPAPSSLGGGVAKGARGQRRREASGTVARMGHSLGTMMKNMGGTALGLVSGSVKRQGVKFLTDALSRFM